MLLFSFSSNYYLNRIAFEKGMKKIAKYATLNALGASLYVILVASFIYFMGNTGFGDNKTGILYDSSPEGLARAIGEVEKNYSQFCPRKYVLKNTGNKKSLTKLKKALGFLAKKDKRRNIYGDIYWDGRNQSLLWEEKAINFIENTLKKLEIKT